MIPGKEAAYLIGLLLAIGGAFLVHRANYALMLIRGSGRQSIIVSMPALFFLLLSSTNPAFLPIEPATAGICSLLLAIYQLFISYHQPESGSRAFNIAFILGTGSLLWVYQLCFLPLFWYGMYKFRSLSLRNFLASIVGLLTVYWFVLGWCVWQSDYTLLNTPLSVLSGIRFPTFTWPEGGIIWFGTAYALLLAVLASVNILLHEHEDALRTRQYLSFLIVLYAWILGLSLFYHPASDEILQVACLPASILIAHFFTVTRGKWFSRFFYVSVIVLFVVYFLHLTPYGVSH